MVLVVLVVLSCVLLSAFLFLSAEALQMTEAAHDSTGAMVHLRFGIFNVVTAQKRLLYHRRRFLPSAAFARFTATVAAVVLSTLSLGQVEIAFARPRQTQQNISPTAATSTSVEDDVDGHDGGGAPAAGAHQPDLRDPLVVFRLLAQQKQPDLREVCVFGLGKNHFLLAQHFLRNHEHSLVHLFDVSDVDRLLALKEEFHARVLFGQDYELWEEQGRKVSCSTVLFSVEGPRFTLERVMENIRDKHVGFIFLSYDCMQVNEVDAKAEGQVQMNGQCAFLNTFWVKTKLMWHGSCSHDMCLAVLPVSDLEEPNVVEQDCGLFEKPPSLATREELGKKMLSEYAQDWWLHWNFWREGANDGVVMMMGDDQDGAAEGAGAGGQELVPGTAISRSQSAKWASLARRRRLDRATGAGSMASVTANSDGTTDSNEDEDGYDDDIHAALDENKGSGARVADAAEAGNADHDSAAAAGAVVSSSSRSGGFPKSPSSLDAAPKTYVDLGGCLPFDYSNTVFFDRCQSHAWGRGLCVEPNPTLTPFLEAYRRCKVLPFCVAERDKPRNVFRYRDGASAFAARCTTLANILLSADLHDVDFLSVDIEGQERKVFSDFPFEAFNVKFVVVEVGIGVNWLVLDTAFLKAGYLKIGILGRDCVYAKRSALRELKGHLPGWELVNRLPAEPRHGLPENWDEFHNQVIEDETRAEEYAQARIRREVLLKKNGRTEQEAYAEAKQTVDEVWAAKKQLPGGYLPDEELMLPVHEMD